MIELILAVMVIAGVVTSVSSHLLKKELKKLKNDNASLYKEFHELNLHVRGTMTPVLRETNNWEEIKPGKGAGFKLKGCCKKK